MSNLRVFVEKMNQIICSERVTVAELFDAELIRVRSIITADLSKVEGTVDKAICDVRDCSSVDASSDAPGPSPWFCSIELRY